MYFVGALNGARSNFDILRVFYWMDQMKCINCKQQKSLDCFELISKPKKHHNGRRKNCIDCCLLRGLKKGKVRRDRSSEKYKRREMKEQKIREIMQLLGDKADINNGFVYLYRCDELDCFKIGHTGEDPREYIKAKSKDYGIKLDLVAFILSPIVRRCDTEWLAHRGLKRVQHTKPCGGEAVELFKCGMNEGVNILRSLSNHIYIEPNPFIDVDQLGSVEMIDVITELDEREKASKYVSSDKVTINKIIKAFKKEKRWIIKDGDGINKSSCCCKSILDKKYIDECKNVKIINNIKLSKLSKVT